MDKIPWANVLHIYQPPTQEEDVVHRIANESYRPLVKGLANTPSAKITLNINASLTEWLFKLGYNDIIKGFADAAGREQVEFLGSGAYHPILPLIPRVEAKRQIMLNQIINRRLFGENYHPKGFFLPEMAYDRSIGELLADLEFSYVILDEVACDSRFNKLVFDRLFKLKGREALQIVFRHRGASDAISFGRIRSGQDLLAALMRNVNSEDRYLVTAMDGETYGHHKKKLDRALFAAYGLTINVGRSISNKVGFIPVTVSELFDRIDNRQNVDPLPSNWSGSSNDVSSGNAFALWKEPDNQIHKWQWELVGLVVKAVREHEPEKGADPSVHRHWKEARLLLDQGLHSDQFWWASDFHHHRKGTMVFWSRDMIRKGTELLFSAIATVPGISSNLLSQARDVFVNISEAVERWEKKRV